MLVLDEADRLLNQALPTSCSACCRCKGSASLAFGYPPARAAAPGRRTAARSGARSSEIEAPPDPQRADIDRAQRLPALRAVMRQAGRGRWSLLLIRYGQALVAEAHRAGVA